MIICMAMYVSRINIAQSSPTGPPPAASTIPPSRIIKKSGINSRGDGYYLPSHHQSTSVLFGRDYRTRTCGLLVPNQALYQAALNPVTGGLRLTSRTSGYDEEQNPGRSSSLTQPFFARNGQLVVCTGIEPVTFPPCRRVLYR